MQPYDHFAVRRLKARYEVGWRSAAAKGARVPCSKPSQPQLYRYVDIVGELVWGKAANCPQGRKPKDGIVPEKWRPPEDIHELYKGIIEVHGL